MRINKGKLSFERNGDDLGIAFEDDALKPKLPNVYAFVSLCMQGDTVEIV